MKWGKIVFDRENIFMFSTLFLLFTIPLNYAYSTTAFILFFLLNLAGVNSIKHIKLSAINIALIAFYGTFLISLFWTESLNESLRAIYKNIPVLLFSILLLIVPKLSQSKLKKIWTYFSLYLCALFVFLLCIAAYKWNSTGNLDSFVYHTLVSPLKLNAIYVSYFVAVALLIQLGNSTKKIPEYIVLSILFIFLILLSSKLVVVLTVICAILQFIVKNKSRFLAVVLGSLVLIGLLVFTPVVERFKTEFKADYQEVLNANAFGEVYDWKGSTIRLLLMRVGVEILDQNDAWVGGVGIGNSQVYIEENLQNKKLYYDFWDYNFHNQFMQILVELGVIGLFAYLILYAVLFKDFRKNAIAISIVLFFFFCGFTESFLWRQRGVLFFLIVIILLYQQKNSYEEKRIT